MWQTLETKARFIQQAMSGRVSVRTAKDIEGGALTYAGIKAIASGNPAVMETAARIQREWGTQMSHRASSLTPRLLRTSAAMPTRAINQWIMPVRIVVHSADWRPAADDILMDNLSAFTTGVIFARSVEMCASDTVGVRNRCLGYRHISLSARADNSMP